jgi:cell division cycle protein 20 (cofactor of APC complex)
MHDVKSQNSIVGKLNSHKGEVCGLALNSNGLVSGSNDNTAMIWDLAMGRLRHTLNGHKAAVKALAWCPWQRNLLATGGGSKDKCIKFWNVETGKCINTVNTESQVSALIWNPTEK